MTSNVASTPSAFCWACRAAAVPHARCVAFTTPAVGAYEEAFCSQRATSAKSPSVRTTLAAVRAASRPTRPQPAPTSRTVRPASVGRLSATNCGITVDQTTRHCTQCSNEG
eukprot:3273011-Prymnesium_polylepis.1